MSRQSVAAFAKTVMPTLALALFGIGFAMSCAPPLLTRRDTITFGSAHQVRPIGRPAAFTQADKGSRPLNHLVEHGQERTDVYGSSRDGVPLTAVVFGKAPLITIIFGGFHGDERSTPGVVEHLRLYLREHPEIWRGNEVILVPLANPDGYKAHSRVNAVGVDINRNFPCDWQPARRAARYNPGPFVGSEPETQAIIGLLKKYSPSKIISIHQPKHCLNWDGEGGRMLANEMHRFSEYKVEGDIGYPTPGSFGKYCDKQLGVGAVTLELPDITSAKAWHENESALIAAIQYIPMAGRSTKR